MVRITALSNLLAFPRLMVTALTGASLLCACTDSHHPVKTKNVGASHINSINSAQVPSAPQQNAPTPPTTPTAPPPATTAPRPTPTNPTSDSESAANSSSILDCQNSEPQAGDKQILDEAQDATNAQVVEAFDGLKQNWYGASL